MGRETKILLGLLATLAGVLLGVLSVKLLVPRPPPGTGPDVAFDPSTAPLTELVEPPALSPRAPAPPPLSPPVADTSAPLMPDGEPPARVTLAGSTDTEAVPRGPAAPPPGETPLPPAQAPVPDHEAVAASAPRQDPFVKPATLEVGADPSARRAAVAPAATSAEPMLHAEAAPAASRQTGLSAAAATQATPAVYVARPGDSWWQVAERAYGDGRFYRALFAWNRVLDPRVSLAPGTRLEVPPRSRLESAWPKLVPGR